MFRQNTLREQLTACCWDWRRPSSSPDRSRFVVENGA
jgi:hypothetical protein